MPDFTVAVGLLKKPIEDLYSAASGAVKEKLALIRATQKVQSLHKRLWESQRVKTIWQTERPLSLSSFFYPVDVIRQIDGGTVKVRLNSLSDLPHNHCIIFGTVGQGKSILLRFLLGKEIRSGTRIPVLCELRNIGDQHLESYLAERFSLLLNIVNDTVLFDTFASSGKISFLLDGFDEIDPAKVQRLMQEIEDLAYKFPTCRIVLTSRPDSECKYLTGFHSKRIAPLSKDDLHPFYKRITRDDEFAKRLAAAVNASPLKIRELVNTPLLATLLAISYRAAHKIPLDFAEFYEELFQILLVRHDTAKQGWRRHRKTKLNDREIQQAFEAFCFASRKRQVLSIEKDLAYQIAQESVGQCHLTADPQGFLDDIAKITCLLNDEGKKLNFVHASVQEFFASRFVKTRAEPVAAKFYQQLAGGKWADWQEELLFLQQIDSHRAWKYFKIPDLDVTLKDLLKGKSAADESVAVDYLKGMRVVKQVREGKEASYTVNRIRPIHTYHYSNLDSRVFSILFTHADGARGWSVGFLQDPLCANRTYFDIAKDRQSDVCDRLLQLVRGSINTMIAERSDLAKKISDEEQATKFTDLI